MKTENEFVQLVSGRTGWTVFWQTEAGWYGGDVDYVDEATAIQHTPSVGSVFGWLTVKAVKVCPAGTLPE